MQVQEHVDTITKTRKFTFLPTEEMLITSDTPAVCPVKACSKHIRRLSTLRAHMGQHPLDEGLDSSSFAVNLEFCCPVLGCVYDKLSERSLGSIKYLKQHYQKVHAIKHLKCDKCHVAFSQQSLLDVHLRQCGRSFQCVCGVVYSSRESYLTHARRKQHEIRSELTPAKRIYPKVQDTSTGSENLKQPTPMNTLTVSPVFGTLKEKVAKPRLLLPKPAPINSVPLPTLAAIALSEMSVMRKSCQKVETGTQTENGLNSKIHCFCCGDAYSTGKTKRGPHCRIGSGVKRSSTVDFGACRQLLSDNGWGSKRLRRTTETQTKRVNEGRQSKRQKACAETQTLGHLILEKAMAEANLPVVGQASIKQENSLRCQSTETQTGETVTAKMVDYVETTGLTRECTSALSHAELMLDNAYPAQRSASSETQTIWPNLNANSAQSMSPLHCDTISTSQNYADLERSTASTQTATPGTLSVGLTQCSSSQTEKDVFLGHMGNPFSSTQAFSPSLASSTLNSVFSPSGCVPLHQVNNQAEACSIQYADLFPHGSSKLNENRVLSSETQTELNFDMLLNCDGDDEQSSDSILCSNIQTQTTDDLESLSYELLTNMHTQTNEDFLFPELTFSDIQTQTSWKDTASPNNSHSVSVHIQTQMPESSTQVINMQTQTFVPPLDIGTEFANSHTQTTWSYMQDLMPDL